MFVDSVVNPARAQRLSRRRLPGLPRSTKQWTAEWDTGKKCGYFDSPGWHASEAMQGEPLALTSSCQLKCKRPKCSHDGFCGGDKSMMPKAPSNNRNSILHTLWGYCILTLGSMYGLVFGDSIHSLPSSLQSGRWKMHCGGTWRD